MKLYGLSADSRARDGGAPDSSRVASPRQMNSTPSWRVSCYHVTSCTLVFRIDTEVRRIAPATRQEALPEPRPAIATARAVHAHQRAARDSRPRAHRQAGYASDVNTTAFRAANGDGSHSARRSAPPREHFPLTRRDYSFIVGFWLIYALLTIANHAFDPGPPDRRPDWTLTTWIIIEVAQAALWMLITPVVVSMAGRARSERVSRSMNFFVLFLLGVAVALGVSIFGYELRDLVRSASPPRAVVTRAGGGGGHGPPRSGSDSSTHSSSISVCSRPGSRAPTHSGLARAGSRRRSSRHSWPRRGSMRCAASSIRIFFSTHSMQCRRSSSAIHGAYAG